MTQNQPWLQLNAGVFLIMCLELIMTGKKKKKIKIQIDVEHQWAVRCHSAGGRVQRRFGGLTLNQ